MEQRRTVRPVAGLPATQRNRWYAGQPARDRSGDTLMGDDWYAGNANDDADQHRGWLLGHFVDPVHGAVRATGHLEVKWGVHPTGQQRPEWTADDQRTTMLI